MVYCSKSHKMFLVPPACFACFVLFCQTLPWIYYQENNYFRLLCLWVLLLSFNQARFDPADSNQVLVAQGQRGVLFTNTSNNASSAQVALSDMIISWNPSVSRTTMSCPKSKSWCLPLQLQPLPKPISVSSYSIDSRYSSPVSCDLSRCLASGSLSSRVQNIHPLLLCSECFCSIFLCGSMVCLSFGFVCLCSL